MFEKNEAVELKHISLCQWVMRLASVVCVISLVLSLKDLPDDITVYDALNRIKLDLIGFAVFEGMNFYFHVVKNNLKSILNGTCKVVQVKGVVVYHNPKKEKVGIITEQNGYFDFPVMHGDLLKQAVSYNGKKVCCELYSLKGLLGEKYILKSFIELTIYDAI